MRPIPVVNPPNPWASTSIEWVGEPPSQGLKIFEDHTREILASNDSPDVPFRWSVNAYRGCLHACAYCYARPTHEYLGYGAGSDFDRIIVIKPEAPALLREAFERRSWRGESVAFSGVTDCYQPVEASYGLTRGCLEVCLDYLNPVGIITKSALIERDLDLLVDLSRRARLNVAISIPIWNEEHSRAIEPLTPTPSRRIRVIEKLSRAGINVVVMVAPIIPGLSDEDIPTILKAARDAGASGAGHQMMRLPGAVAQVFQERVEAAFPLRAGKILARTREMRGGKLNESRFGLRNQGEGEHAKMIEQLFKLHVQRLGFERSPSLDEGETTFRRPTDRGGQLRLF